MSSYTQEHNTRLAAVPPPSILLWDPDQPESWPHSSPPLPARPILLKSPQNPSSWNLKTQNREEKQTNKMRINIRPAVPSDAPTLAAINIDAFAGQVFLSNTFPNLGYEVVHHFKTARYRQKIAQPRINVLAAVDEDTGALVGCARWLLPATGDQDQDRGKDKPAESASGAESELETESESTSLPLPEGTNRAVYDGFFETLKEKAKSHLRDDDIVLEFLATLPEYQGNGVGKALLRWGMEQADRQQRRIYLEATREGYPVYEKCGWRGVERIEIDYGRWGGEGSQELTLMVRDPLLG
ncbi:acyl-CoA N-acyltransferase [Aspergillus navahoensis]